MKTLIVFFYNQRFGPVIGPTAIADCLSASLLDPKKNVLLSMCNNHESLRTRCAIDVIK